jgi:hypothetical protein
MQTNPCGRRQQVVNRRDQWRPSRSFEPLDVGADVVADRAARTSHPKSALFPGDIIRPPRAWLERTANVVRVTEPARGGHFAPFEEPELYAQELRAFPPLQGGGTGLTAPPRAAAGACALFDPDGADPPHGQERVVQWPGSTAAKLSTRACYKPGWSPATSVGRCGARRDTGLSGHLIAGGKSNLTYAITDRHNRQ